MVKQNCSLRLLSICDITSNRCGSFEDFLINLSKKTSELGYEHIIVFRGPPDKKVKTTLESFGSTVKVMKPSRLSLFTMFNVRKQILDERPSIIHFHFYPIHTIINCLTLFYDVKFVYTAHMGGKCTNNLIKKTIRKLYYSISSLLFDRFISKIVCVSNYVMFNFFRNYGIYTNKSCLIYNGIDMAKYSKCTPNNIIKNNYGLTNELVITTVGLRKEKGPYYLLESIPIIKKAFKM